MAIPKIRYPDYDVVVMNTINRPIIELINPNLIQEFLSGKNLNNYVKSKSLSQNFKRGLGEGIFLSEDKIWKMKRKVLNAVFNFDFIKSLAPKIAKLCDNILDNLDKGFEGKEGSYNIREYTTELGSYVILDCFFGHNFLDEKIEGVHVSAFVQKLIGDLTLQNVDPAYIILGLNFVKLGLRKKDKDINRRLKLYKAWGNDFVQKKV